MILTLELTMAHDPVHVEAMKLLPDMKQDERERLADTLDSIYLNEESYNRYAYLLVQNFTARWCSVES